jgi:hypothetical protein
MFPTLDKIELFAREVREHYDCWGDQAPDTNLLDKLYAAAGDPPCSVLAMATTITSIDT